MKGERTQKSKHERGGARRKTEFGAEGLGNFLSFGQFSKLCNFFVS